MISPAVVDDPLHEIARMYGIRSPHSAREIAAAFRAEVLRSLLWAFSLKGAEPVTTSLLMNRAERITSLLPECDRGDKTPELKRLQRTLFDLANIRDFANLPNGRWLPAPTRLVAIPTDQWLLVGGYPTGLFPPTEQGSVNHVGTARWLISNPPGVYQELRHQPYDEWLGRFNSRREEPLERFKSSKLVVIDSIRSKDWKVYAPLHARVLKSHFQKRLTWETSHGQRWLNTGRSEMTGRFLITSFEPRRGSAYAIGEMINGSLTMMSENQVPHNEARRLQYEIDRNDNVPLVMHWSSMDAHTTRLRQWCALPDTEERLLLVCGTAEQVLINRSYPRDWTFRTIQHFATASRGLEQIGIVLKEQVLEESSEKGSDDDDDD